MLTGRLVNFDEHSGRRSITHRRAEEVFPHAESRGLQVSGVVPEPLGADHSLGLPERLEIHLAVAVHQLPDVVPHDAHEEHRDGDRDEHPVADVRVEAERAHIGELLRGDTRCARFKSRQRILVKSPREMIRNVTRQAHFDGRGRDDDGLEAESQDRRSGCRGCRCQGDMERRVDQEGHKAEESPEALRAVRARGEVPLEVQGVQRLSARTSALYMQGVRWVCILRARSSAQ